MALFKKKRDHKFCPVCGAQIKLDDAFCTRCGYSFVNRQKSRSGIKWKRILIILIILALIYFGLRYSAGQSIIPLNWQDALNFTR